LKRNSLYTGRFALTGAAFAAMCLVASNALALGLGRLSVQSALGETLRAEIDVTSITPEEASNLNIRVAPPESYRAAGVDYNSVLPSTQVVLQRRPDGRSVLILTSDRAAQEPFVDVILEITWSTGRLVREYTLLLDPPTTRVAAAPVPPAGTTTAPVITPAPTPAEPTPRPERRPDAPRASAPSTDSSEPRKPAVTRAPAVSSGDAVGIDEYKVKPGDSLSRIAGRTQRPGVSLDQMLASLYQANPDAFINSNMNRLKSGVVLSVPSADAAKAVTPAEARQMIQAQSADFGTYRQRLAAAVTSAPTDAPSRQAGGKVQSSVEDRKASAAPTPDKLTLSKGTAGKASGPEDRLSKEREKKDASARVAELSKNVEELKKLSGASAAAGGKAPATAPAAAPAAKPPVVVPPVAPPKPPVVAVAPPPAPVAPPPPPPAPPPVAPPVVPPVVATAPTSASAPVMAASAPAVVAAASAASAAVPASAPMVAAPASRPAPPPVAAVPAAEPPGMFASLLEDNPLVLAAGAALIALLAGFGIYRFTKRAKKDSGETSFLESRLQPDSFFGASGGQRIDTRDAGGTSSSMSYSLSQLDAIGDVDPVAEADVYLAYGRDLQAEEILKEAMRASPERLAIRTKLLEVYAKRRDTKGFELLATQLFGLTGGQGEDWAKAQEIGLQIDPENPLYQPGGKPSGGEGEGRPSAELLGASTMPQSVLPSPSEFGASGNSGSGFDSTSGSGVDLDLDLGLNDSAPASAPVARMDERTQPLAVPPSPAPAPAPSFDAMSFNLPPAPAPAPAAPASQSMDFDLGSISLDLGDESTIAQPKAAQPAAADFGTIDLGDAADDGADPIARKLELAEEFRQIGDMEGARDLLQEVVAKSSGAVKSRAQTMLNDLG
jgi:pilus assembly protein FimV